LHGILAKAEICQKMRPVDRKQLQMKLETIKRWSRLKNLSKPSPTFRQALCGVPLLYAAKQGSGISESSC